MNAMERLKLCRCCACDDPIGSSTVNLVATRCRAEWPNPTASNLITGYGPSAIALVCDSCVAARRQPTRVIELPESGGEVYHRMIDLEDLGPQPTHVVLSDPRSDDQAIRCLVCEHVSFDPDDILNLYCGRCRKFHPIDV